MEGGDYQNTDSQTSLYQHWCEAINQDLSHFLYQLTFSLIQSISVALTYVS
jgi:hypothetical protein